MQIISLFSGIGGFELAGEWAGWTPVVSCEINPFGQRVLKYYWPNAYHHDDVKTLNYDTIRAKSNWDPTKATIVVGGFPCQPYSHAGKRLGKEDDRHLWPEMLRVIREVRPKWVVGENVSGLLSWNGGLVFDEVQADLEAEGYEVQPFILPAASVGAPHKRERVWFVAYACGNGQHGTENGQGDTKGNDVGETWEEPVEQFEGRGCEATGKANTYPNSAPTRNEIQTGGHLPTGNVFTDAHRAGRREGNKKNEGGPSEQFDGNSFSGNDTDTYGLGLQRWREQNQRKEAKRQIIKCGSSRIWNAWENFPSQPPVCSGNDGFPTQLDGITFSKWRNESIKAMGNAIVPQVAYQIFKAINMYEASLLI